MTEQTGAERAGGVEIVRVGGWERFSWLRHGFSTRAGGVSQVYGLGVGAGGGSLNLGWTKEDEAEAVRENRRRFVRAAVRSGDGMALVGLRQVHSAVVQAVKAGDGALEGRLESAEGRAVLEGDGLVTEVPGVLLGVGTADCVPVLVVDGEKRVVGAFHAGWRGTVGRIVEAGVARMEAEYGSRREDLLAAVGPSIGSCCYAVGDEVREGFGANFSYAGELFRRVPVGGRSSDRFEAGGDTGDAGAMYLDLWESNRRQLVDAGVGEERITVIGECTACARNGDGSRRYFSHRAEHGVAGRMLSVVGVAGSGLGM